MEKVLDKFLKYFLILETITYQLLSYLITKKKKLER